MKDDGRKKSFEAFRDLGFLFSRTRRAVMGWGYTKQRFTYDSIRPAHTFPWLFQGLQ